VRELGADEVIDYRTQAFEDILHGYDLVLDSRGGENLERSLRVLAPGGKAIGIAGPPDPAFARKAGLNPVLRLVIAGLSSRIRRRARTLGVSYEFLLMSASGDQLRRIAALVDQGVLRPVVGEVLAFDDTPQALAELPARSIRGKAVIAIAPLDGHARSVTKTDTVTDIQEGEPSR
jgi:NADPH:quinone reductase-like Zn-dependent oxidoreductase